MVVINDIGGVKLMRRKQPSVLIVILNYRTFYLTIDLIKDLKNNLNYDNYTIMVIDNCSPNESVTVLEERSKDLSFIFYPNSTNTGYAAGNNIGIRYGIQHGFDYSWILNNDVVIRDEDVLLEMVETAEKNINVAVVGPKVFSSENIPVAPYCNRPSFWDFVIGIKKERDYRNTQIDVTREVYCVHGCCMLLKNTAMALVDCMDERTFLYCEENILAERLLNKGYITCYLPIVSIKHNEGSTTRLSCNKLIMKLQEQTKSRELYLKEYRRFHFIARWLCHLTRGLITVFRNR